jgi:hypothetical protein
MAALLGKVSGLASKVPGVGGLVPSIPKVPTVAGAAAEGQNKVKQFLLEGFSIPWVALLVLAGFPPVPPISFWGYGAVNLMAAGSKGWAMAKAALQLAFVAASKYIGVYYPKVAWINWILWLNPWFVFDIVQLFSPTFETEGFKVPFVGTQIRPEDGVYKLNGIVIGIMLGLFSLGGFSLLSYLPPAVVGAAEPALKLLFKIIGGVAAVGGGGLGMMLLPELLKSAKEDVGAVKAAAVAAAPVQAAALPGPLKQQGGAAAGSIPPLHEVAAGLLDPSTVIRGHAELGAPFRSTVITGGGRSQGSQPSTADSAVFVGVLGLAALAGLGLAAVRSKADSPA